MSVLGTIYLWEGLGKAATTKTGPNDAFDVVWAIRKFFFPFFCILLSLMTVLGTTYLREGLGKAATTKTGPNDVFGPFVSYFFFLSCLLILTSVFRQGLETCQS
jgi:hypothetical protein